MRTLFASSVGIGEGKESTEGGGDRSGDVGREETRLINRLLDDVDFFSFTGTTIVGDGSSDILGDSTRIGCSVVALVSSCASTEDAEENEPTRWRVSVNDGGG